MVDHVPRGRTQAAWPLAPRVAVSCKYEQVHLLPGRYDLLFNAPAPRIERSVPAEQRLCVGEQPARDLRYDRLKLLGSLDRPPAEQCVPGVAGHGLCFGRHDMEQCDVGIAGGELLGCGHGRLPRALDDPDENAHLTLPTVSPPRAAPLIRGERAAPLALRGEEIRRGLLRCPPHGECAAIGAWLASRRRSGSARC